MTLKALTVEIKLLKANPPLSVSNISINYLLLLVIVDIIHSM